MKPNRFQAPYINSKSIACNASWLVKERSFSLRTYQRIKLLYLIKPPSLLRAMKIAEVDNNASIMWSRHVWPFPASGNKSGASVLSMNTVHNCIEVLYITTSYIFTRYCKQSLQPILSIVSIRGVPSRRSHQDRSKEAISFKILHETSLLKH